MARENHTLFESRKADHIRLALEGRMQATGGSGLANIRLVHEAMPDLDFSDVTIATQLFSREIASPLFISSMTAGHDGGVELNRIMATVAGHRGWAMGVGSQRRQLHDSSADAEWISIRKSCPKTRFFGNIGLAQLISSKTDDIRRLADTLEAEGVFVHLNPLQECLQPEGTPQFKGGLKALKELVQGINLPVIVKETGCGFSSATLKRLAGIGVAAVDVSGFGGTHWGRIEGGRAGNNEILQQTSETFRDWGIGTVESLLMALEAPTDYEIWASGGIRSGLDAAKCLAIGARMIGVAKPIIEAALKGEKALDSRMQTFENELKTALFCTGSQNLNALRENRVWEHVAKP